MKTIVDEPGRLAAASAGAATGIARWVIIHDDLLRWLSHAMSNRLTAVSILAGAHSRDTDIDKRVLENLGSEVEQLEVLLQTLRLLPERTGAAPEPMLVTDAVDMALRLLAHHPGFVHRKVVVRKMNDIVPVLADPVALAHAVVVSLLASARRLGPGSDIVVFLETAGAEVIVRAESDITDDRADVADLIDRAAVDWLLSGSNGCADATTSGCVIRIRTLAAARAGLG